MSSWKNEKEEGVKVDAYELGHNKENEKKLLEIDKDMCGKAIFLEPTN